MKVQILTTLGPIVLELDRTKAPTTVENFAAYVSSGHYDGTIFHLKEGEYRLCSQERHCAWLMDAAIGLDVSITDETADVAALAVQGPKAETLMTGLFGDGIAALPYFGFGTFDMLGTRQVIARSGYSKQGGFELYLDGFEHGLALWDALWEAGQPFNILPGSPNLIERVEGGLLSLGNEMTSENNPQIGRAHV